MAKNCSFFGVVLNRGIFYPPLFIGALNRYLLPLDFYQLLLIPANFTIYQTPA